MHILVLSKRNAQAEKRLVRAAEALAVYFELDPALVAGLKPKEKDKNVRGLKQREGAATLVEALALKVGALEEPAAEEEAAVTAVTEPEGAEPPDEPTPENAPGDDLPPPVLETDEVQGAAVTDDGGVDPHTGDEFVTEPAALENAHQLDMTEKTGEAIDEERIPVEGDTLIEEPVEEAPAEELVEEEPEEKPASKSKKKSSRKKK